MELNHSTPNERPTQKSGDAAKPGKKRPGTDYWYMAFRNFRILGIILLVVIIASLALGFDPAVSDARYLSGAIVAMVFGVAYIWIAYLFKRGSSKAITAGYTIITIAVLGNIVSFFFSMDVLNLGFTLLIAAYLYWNVYKAQKQEPPSTPYSHFTMS